MTTIAEAHLESLGSLDAIAAAKGELFEALPPGATAVVNADDELVRAQAERFPGRRVTYGFTAPADVRGSDYAPRPAGLAFAVSAFGGPEVTVSCGLSGRHNAANVLAGLAAAAVLEVPLPRAAEAVAALRPLPGRGRRIGLAGGAVAVDRDLQLEPAGASGRAPRIRPRTGPAAHRRHRRHEGTRRKRQSLHYECGEAAASLELDLVVGVGPLGAVFAVAASLRETNTLFAADPAEAAALLAEALRPGDLVLFKASRAVGLDDAIRRLRPPEAVMAEEEGA